jgi:hypothetical protein
MALRFAHCAARSTQRPLGHSYAMRAATICNNLQSAVAAVVVVVVVVVVVDGTGKNISKDVRDVCDSFHVAIEFASAGASGREENARAEKEKGVQDIGRITRALFVGAPHAPQSFCWERGRRAGRLQITAQATQRPVPSLVFSSVRNELRTA